MSSPDIYELVKNDTLIKTTGVAANIKAVDHIVENNIPGAIIECGVYRGGSVAAMLYRLLELGDNTREIYLYDTYTGMSEPSEEDAKIGGTHEKTFEKYERVTDEHITNWCYGPLGIVQQVINRTNYPPHKVTYIKGMVEDTLPNNTINEIAILRLDTDFYESTKAELKHLYPKVVPNGVIILDDYGVWQGARKAVDEYFNAHEITVDLIEVDEARRYFYKQ